MTHDEALTAIRRYYGNRTAARSGVSLLNHIYEGLALLRGMGAPEDTQIAFALHPMFQSDQALRDEVWANPGLARISPGQMLRVMEYRHIANASLSDIVGLSAPEPEDERPPRPFLKRNIRLSPVEGVNLMLIADKVQNRKDFEKYHKDTHPRSQELAFYFDMWLVALGVSEETYRRMIKDIS